MVAREANDVLDGEVVAILKGTLVLVRLVDGREIHAVVNRSVARDAYFIAMGDRVKVALRDEPKKARIIEMQHPKK